MIDRKDLKVGLATECGKVITAIGKYSVLYEYERGDSSTAESFEGIDTFCELYSIKKKKVEVSRWMNIYENGSDIYSTKDIANDLAKPDAIAVAVELRGSYEV